MWCSIGLKLAMGILKRMLPKLKQHVEQSSNPYDDLAVQAVEQVLAVHEEGLIEDLLCK